MILRPLPISMLLIAALLACPVAGEPLRIGSWNIENLHHREDFALRAFGDDYLTQKRRASDFALLQKYRDLFGTDGRAADVIALQEIGTVAALERLFPSAIYETLISPRWENDDAPEGAGEVFTAVAVRRASGARVVEAAHLPELAVLHADGNATRAGTGALIDYAGGKFWFLSVHMKSSCATTRKVHESVDADCVTHWAQVKILADWIDRKRASGTPIIIAGDFNRRFRQLSDDDVVWKALNGVEPGEDLGTPWFEKHPLTLPRNCPTRRGAGTQPVDWILVGSPLAGRVVDGSFFERRYDHDDVAAAQGARGLSDHCPISLDIELANAR